ncbi:LamG-like jellyroll fold domain-containing protein [Yinghuangia seranimata]|uniref:LamG-like jellyroll fold domain-containing protein n=1 Tax=Yinghuangia seranimata TaxID=408067 RepID=UPI00248CE6C5|nr:LamG-like jellyroll fold domain-containing protein [Yinghuangia seranimata]MDI2128897.1 DUF2510 domain-containing protein [Yinghuangia seranimata]
MTTGDKPSGWYADPDGRAETLRWWDGSAWTDAVRQVPGPGPETAGGPAPRGYHASISAAVWPVGGEPPPPPPVRFEAVEPNRTRKRLLLGLAAVLIAAVATTGGYFWGAAGAGDDPHVVAWDERGQPPPPPPPPPTTPGPAAPTGQVPVARPEALPPDLVAWYRMDAPGGGVVPDASKAAQNATTSGTVTWSAEHGGSMLFDGRGTLQTAKPVLDTTKSFTVAAWASVSSTGAFQTVVAQDGAQVSGFYLHYNKDAGTWAFVRTSNDTANPPQWFTAAGRAPAKPDTWTHLAGVFDAATGTMTLYVDGVAQGSVVDPVPWRANGPLTIGRAAGNVDMLHGTVGDVQAYARALSAAEVAGLAAAR